MRIPHDPVFYDFEASRTFDGFPIEVGWAFVANDGDVLISDSRLIRPAAEWDIDNGWDDDAQTLHGIDKAMLLAEGHHPYQVTRHMNAVLQERILFSDSPLDEKWLNDLYDAAGLSPSFEVRRTSCETLIQSFASSAAISSLDLQRLTQDASIHAPQTHRAEADALHWACLWRELLRARHSSRA
jgi:hypothetical protein